MSREDCETYRALIYTLCDKYMIVADPKSLTIRVNLKYLGYKYLEIQVALVGCHSRLVNNFNEVIHTYFCNNIISIVEYINNL